jgi:chromosome transmission fidelity protein 4
LASCGNAVQVFKHPDFDRDGIEFRFAAPVTTIVTNKMWMAAGSEDGTIKVQKLNKSEDAFELKGHSAVILKIDVSVNNHLASSSGDGTIRVWNLNTHEVIKTFDGLDTVGSLADAKVFSTPVFEKSGRYLAFPQGKLINIVETSKWEIKFKLENSEIRGKYTACSFSHCGLYIAAGTLHGEIGAWSLSDNLKIKGDYIGEEDHAITSLEWNPKLNHVAFCDNDGQLSTIVLSTLKKTDDSKKAVHEDNLEENDIDDIYNGIDFRDDEAEDDDDDDNENCVALEKLKNETIKNNGSDNSDMSDDDDDVKTVKSSDRYPMATTTTLKPFNLQPAFQIGSTPEHLEHRFMIWNHIGQVLCHTSSDENSIIVEFHDATLHPSLHILNTLNHKLASLSSTCLALATKDTPCKLVCIALLSSGNKEWSTTMPDCEEIKCIATGNSFVAVATDAHYIRLFTTMGTQREIVMVPGPIVCLSASDNKLVAVYHTSNTCNKYSLMIINVIGLSVTNRTIELPITKDSKISWIGFSDCGSIIAHDSTGVMISYSIKRNLWMPICNTSEIGTTASDSFFIIGVSEKTQKIRVSLCRGTNYPLTNPRPIMREIDYCMPHCLMETDKSKFEESLIRSANFDVDLQEKNIIEYGLKLFCSALNSELESRAFEIVELIGNKKLIEMSAKYATQKGRIHMAGKITNLMHKFEEKVCSFILDFIFN